MLKFHTDASGGIASVSCGGYLWVGITDQNTFLTPVLPSSNCTNAFWLVTKGYKDLSSFCLCSVLPRRSPVHVTEQVKWHSTARYGRGSPARPNVLLLLEAGKAHGHWKHLSGFQTLAFNTKNLHTFTAFFIILKDTLAKWSNFCNSSALHLAGEQNQKWAFSLSLWVWISCAAFL